MAVRYSATFARHFRRLPDDVQRRIKRGLHALENDPLTPRSGADIKRLSGSDPPKLRLRVGDYRILYQVEKGGAVFILYVFGRGRGYRLD